MANRKRNIPIQFWVNDAEQKNIHDKMAQCGTSNMAAYLRKMALDGYIVRLDLPELQEISSLMRRFSNNLNQIARRANETRRVYDEDLQEILENQRQILMAMDNILRVLSALG